MSEVLKRIFYCRFKIRVEARDSGVPTWLSTDLDLVIYVRNVDDCPPQFLVDVFQVNFTGSHHTLSHVIEFVVFYLLIFFFYRERSGGIAINQVTLDSRSGWSWRSYSQ